MSGIDRPTATGNRPASQDFSAGPLHPGQKARRLPIRQTGPML